MQRTAAKRISQYDARYDPTSWALKVAAVEEGAKLDFASFVNEFVPMRDAVVAVCNTLGVLPLILGQYLAFASKLFHIQQYWPGDSPGAQTQAAILVAQWASRGLSQNALETIRDEVFGISAPA